MHFRSITTFLLFLGLGSSLATLAQNRPGGTIPGAGGGTGQTGGGTPTARASSPKPYGEVITDKAKTDEGLFKVHRLDDKWFFEVPDSLIGRDILVVTRISKSATGLSNGFSGYAGDIVNNNVIRFEKGPNSKLFLRRYRSIREVPMKTECSRPLSTPIRCPLCNRLM
jgi:hypothetical protein